MKTKRIFDNKEYEFAGWIRKKEDAIKEVETARAYCVNARLIEDKDGGYNIYLDGKKQNCDHPKML